MVGAAIVADEFFWASWPLATIQWKVYWPAAAAVYEYRPDVSTAAPLVLGPACSDEVTCTNCWAPVGSVITRSSMSLKPLLISLARSSPLKNCQLKFAWLPASRDSE